MTPEAFLKAHDMHFSQMPFEELTRAYLREMKAGLRGEPSSLMMLPSYIRSGQEPCRGESVLVLDAGGTNLRAGRVHFDENGLPVVELLRKTRMPGSEGKPMSAGEMFRRMAAFALEAARGCSRACISFSYACKSLPDGDGEILSLSKELQITGAEGTRVCAPLEAALQALGAGGERRWRLVNDTVGSLLGCMAETDRSRFDDFIGFILGTGTNACCSVPSAWITKDPAAMALGGESIVNLESGCFNKALQGEADRALDAASIHPGEYLAEKMISGSYYRQVLSRTLDIAVREGVLAPSTGKRLSALRITSPLIDAFCLAPQGDNPLAAALETAEQREFCHAVNDMLLERAARVAAACLCAVVELRGMPRGSRTGICADGTMLRLNPVLQPKMERYLHEYAGERLGVETEFLFAGDATLLGCAWAGLID